MQQRNLKLGPALFALAILLAIPAGATTILRLNLEQMVARSGQIFRGTVQDFRTGTIEAGGGTLPTVTYIFQVEEGLKGDFGAKEHPTVEVTMIGTIKEDPSLVDGAQRLSALPKLPAYSIGSDYLVMLTPESSIGLSTSVGLDQGTFTVFNQDHEDFAVNALDNANLGSGVEGPIRYKDLANMIRELVGE